MRDQLPYVKAVIRWCNVHYNLEDTNRNKITARNRGVFLISNLFGRAQDLIWDVKYEIVDQKTPFS